MPYKNPNSPEAKVSMFRRRQKYSSTPPDQIKGNIRIECQCGCGREFWLLDSHRRKKRFVSGHNNRGRKISPEIVKKMLARRDMSGLELRVDGIIKKYHLPYRFVGNGSFMIGRKNPDFMRTTNEKIVVEVYWKRHKEQVSGIDVNQWMDTRKTEFMKHGYETIFLESSDINERYVLNKLGGGVYAY